MFFCFKEIAALRNKVCFIAQLSPNYYLLLQVKFVWLEDMYVTGVLAENVGLNHIDNSPHHVLRYNQEPEKMKNAETDKKVYLIGHIPTVDDAYKYWKVVQNFTAPES